MSGVKYTKTATFLFPLLEIPKAIFDCSIKDINGRVKFKNRFINAYLQDDHIINYISTEDISYVFIVMHNYRDPEFETFYSTIKAFPNYVDDYECKACLVLVFSIPEGHKANFQLILQGSYSKIDALGKKLILSNHFYSGKAFTLPLILNKADVLKQSWEDRLSLINAHTHSPADLLDQEVWPIINLDDEIFFKTSLAVINQKMKLLPSEEFK